jgi:hypothetical protein
MPPCCTQCRVSDDVLTHYKPLYERIKGPFLLPPNFPGHTHVWVQLDTGYCICSLCGHDHVCFRGECPLAESDASERVCTVTGCVVEHSEMRAEWDAVERVALYPSSGSGGRSTEPLCSRAVGGMEIAEFVELVVSELLNSAKTHQCIAEEHARDYARRVSALSRLLKEAGPYPNLVIIEAKLTWLCRKSRRGRRDVVDRVIAVCVDSICSLLRNYGWHRVARQLQHATRGREFVCSMLYLMRVGITFQNRCLLQRLDVLHELLPLQVFLPSIFGIRAKSITEGENIIKLDIRRIPL